MTSPLFRTISHALGIVFLVASGIGQTWDRDISPGIHYRMEVQKDPARVIVGLRFDPRQIRMESQIAKGVIYDSTKANGRDSVSGMVKQFGATAGVNGDFFQFGVDPGGDPEGLVVRYGELISLPGAKDRALSLMWNASNPFALRRPSVSLSLMVGGKQAEINQLNARTGKAGLNLTTETGAQVYGDEKMTVVDLESPNLLLTPNSTLEAKVISQTTTDKRVECRLGHCLLSAIGDSEAILKSLKPGDVVKLKAKSSGVIEGASAHAIGGWPELLKNSAYAGLKDNGTRHPRTAVGRTAEGYVWQVIIDGRQTMSVGASYTETAEIMKAWGCVDAINLDGGGSSAINAFGLILNRPSGGVERLDANGILSYGRAPVASGTVTIKVSDGLTVGKDGTATVYRDGVQLAYEKVVLAAQGSAWIKPDGTITPLTPGECEVSALVEGVVVRTKVTIAPVKL